MIAFVAVFFCLSRIRTIRNTKRSDKKGFPLIWGPRKRLPFLGHKGSCQCGKIALTDEGFVNLFKDKYNDASHLPLIRHFPRKMPPSPEGEGYYKRNRNEINERINNLKMR